MGDPEQEFWDAGVALTAGLGLTITVALVELEHPAPVVAVILNKVVC